MAARSGGGGTGLVVAMVIVSVLAVGMFVTTVVFYSQKQAAEVKLDGATKEFDSFVRANEKSRDDVQAVLAAAKADGNKSAISYLTETSQNLMAKITGNKRMPPKDLETALEKVEGAKDGNLLGVIRERDGRVTALQGQLKDAQDALQRARADLENEAKRVGSIEESKSKTLAALTAEVDKYKDEVEKYRQELNAAKARMDQEIDKTKETARAREAELAAQVRESQEKSAIASETIKRLQEQLRGKAFKPGDEFALVDGTVVGAESGAGQFFISLGRKDKIVLGMTFEVYSQAAAIRPDDKTGEYPRGKATIEVITLDDTTATARVVRETRGNPIVKGDVIANAVYDPKKVYRFHIYGLFDSNSDGLATQQEQADIEAIVREWGGVIANELTGDVDFLVLGQKPVLPPPPPATAPAAVMQEYLRQRNFVQQYDRLWEQANATSIPILNENRLRTLTGLGSRR